MRTNPMRALAAAALVVLGLTAQSCEPAPPPEPVNDTTTRSAWPQDSTTGPELSGLDEDALPSCGHDGSWAITEPGTYGDCLHTGLIRVRSDDVTLRNMVVAGTPLSPVVQNEATGLRIERSIIFNARDPELQPCAASVAFGNYTMVESEVYGCADGVKLAGTVVIDKSFIHDMSRWCEPGQPPSPTTCTHNDAIQHNDQAGRLDVVHLTLTHSGVYLNSCISNVAIQTPNVADSTFDVRRNFFYGSHGVMKMGKEATETNTGAITENLIAGTPTAGPFNAPDGHTSPGLWTGGGQSQISKAGNYFESGDPVPVSGQMDPYTCEPTAPPATTTTSTTEPTTTTTEPEPTTTSTTAP